MPGFAEEDRNQGGFAKSNNLKGQQSEKNILEFSETNKWTRPDDQWPARLICKLTSSLRGSLEEALPQLCTLSSPPPASAAGASWVPIQA